MSRTQKTQEQEDREETGLTICNHPLCLFSCNYVHKGYHKEGISSRNHPSPQSCIASCSPSRGCFLSLLRESSFHNIMVDKSVPGQVADCSPSQTPTNTMSKVALPLVLGNRSNSNGSNNNGPSVTPGFGTILIGSGSGHANRRPISPPVPVVASGTSSSSASPVAAPPCLCEALPASTNVTELILTFGPDRTVQISRAHDPTHRTLLQVKPSTAKSSNSTPSDPVLREDAFVVWSKNQIIAQLHLTHKEKQTRRPSSSPTPRRHKEVTSTGKLWALASLPVTRPRRRVQQDSDPRSAVWLQSWGHLSFSSSKSMSDYDRFSFAFGGGPFADCQISALKLPGSSNRRRAKPSRSVSPVRKWFHSVSPKGLLSSSSAHSSSKRKSDPTLKDMMILPPLVSGDDESPASRARAATGEPDPPSTTTTKSIPPVTVHVQGKVCATYEPQADDTAADTPYAQRCVTIPPGADPGLMVCLILLAKNMQCGHLQVLHELRGSSSKQRQLLGNASLH